MTSAKWISGLTISFTNFSRFSIGIRSVKGNHVVLTHPANPSALEMLHVSWEKAQHATASNPPQRETTRILLDLKIHKET